MKINITSVLKNEGASLNINGSTDVGTLSYLGNSFEFSRPISITAKLRNIGGTLELNGELSGSYTSHCDSCGAPINGELWAEIDESIDSDFVDVDEECFRLIGGNTLDISGLINALIWNNLPMKQLCREDCKGLCSVCGCNKNETVCNCDTGFYDPRFAILREQLK